MTAPLEHGAANIRWLCYARPLTVAERWKRDGNNANFMVWIIQRWGEWAKLTGRDRYTHTRQDHEDFDAWLQSQPGGPLEER